MSQPHHPLVAAVSNQWLYLHPQSRLPETVCFKCGREESVGRCPMRARGAQKIGFNLYQLLTVQLKMPLCARCDWIGRNGGALIATVLGVGFTLPVLAVLASKTIGIGLAMLFMLVLPIAAFVAAIVLYRRSAFELGGVDEYGAIEIRWVHPRALAEVEAQALQGPS